jgi:uracil phosphoribosyltransferase
MEKPVSPDAPEPMAGRSQPDRSEVEHLDRLTVLDHPLCSDLLATIRNRKSSSRAFGRAAALLAQVVIWEAARQIETSDTTVEGFDGTPLDVRAVLHPPAGLSILRAGEIFSGPFRALFPAAPLYHLGVRRYEQTLEHECYLDTLPTHIAAERVMILDPMLATGGSILVALKRLRSEFSGPVDVLALVSAPLGVQTVLSADVDARVVTAALDDRLNSLGYILPGLGDAGDRLYGTTG